MQWGVQHVRITLEEGESGELLVIEQTSDGRVVCERGLAAKGRRGAKGGQAGAEPAAKSSSVKPPAEAAAKEPESKARGARGKGGSKAGAKARPAPAKAEQPEEKAQRKPKEKATSVGKAEPVEAPAKTPPAKAKRGRPKKAPSEAPSATNKAAKAEPSKVPEPEPEARARRRRTSLEWKAVRDHEYDGFAATSGKGLYKVLITRGSQWALFYERPGAWPRHLGCFELLDRAKAKAHELHDGDGGEPEPEVVTAGQIAQACPAPVKSVEPPVETAAEVEPEAPKPKRAPRAAKGTGKGRGRGKAKAKAEAEPTVKPEGELAPAAPSEPVPTPTPDTTEAAQDKELTASFAGAVLGILDEEEDD